MLISLKNIF